MVVEEIFSDFGQHVPVDFLFRNRPNMVYFLGSSNHDMVKLICSTVNQNGMKGTVFQGWYGG